MYKYIVFFLAVLSGFTITAQTINLGGIVSNNAGQPVANAIVTLVRQAMKDTTGTDGKYLFVKTTPVRLQAIIPQSEAISIRNGLLEFSLCTPSTVKIEIFDIKGNLLKKEIVPGAAAGLYRFDFAKNCNATNLLVIKASIDKHEVSFPYITLNEASR